MDDLFRDIDQDRRIAEAQLGATSAIDKAAQFDHRLSEVERRGEKQALAAQALWEILKERLQLSDELMTAKMLEIDMRDGVADGRMRAQVVNCMGCNRPINSVRPKCVYCGTLNDTGQIV